MSDNDSQRSTQHTSRKFTVNVAVNVVAPLILYEVLVHWHVSSLHALAISAVCPLIMVVVGLVGEHQLDVLAVLSLITVVLGVSSALITGDARIAVAKDAVVTAGFALVMLGSLLAPKPLMFFFAKKFGARHQPEGNSRFDNTWRKSPNFRRTMRLVTVLWGALFLLLALVQVVSPYTLSVSAANTASQIGQIMVLAVLVFLTIGIVRHSRAATRSEVANYDGARGTDDG